MNFSTLIPTVVSPDFARFVASELQPNSLTIKDLIKCLKALGIKNQATLRSKCKEELWIQLQMAAKNQFPSLNGLRVLLVDSNFDSIEVIRTVLQESLILVEVADSVKSALEILANMQIDFLVSEIAIPDEDGYSLIRQIRILEQCGHLKFLPAIALTSYITQKGCKEALNSGFQLYLKKPIELDKLLTIIACIAG